MLPLPFFGTCLEDVKQRVLIAPTQLWHGGTPISTGKRVKRGWRGGEMTTSSATSAWDYPSLPSAQAWQPPRQSHRQSRL